MNELGELRPSQLIFVFGVGSLVDLPNMSAMVMGLDDWDTRYCKELEEDRLVAAVQKRLGPQMNRLYLPPIKLENTDRDPAAPAIGVPVAPFPRWMRCSLCDALSTVESGVFKLIQDQWRPDKTAYVHQGCLKSQGGKAPPAHSVRFLLACREGHLTDFPWLNFVHKGNVSNFPLLSKTWFEGHQEIGLSPLAKCSVAFRPPPGWILSLKAFPTPTTQTFHF
jgi:hypothetical protein